MKNSWYLTRIKKKKKKRQIFNYIFNFILTGKSDILKSHITISSYLADCGFFSLATPNLSLYKFVTEPPSNHFGATTGFFFLPIVGPQVVGDLFLEVIRAFYSYCKDALGSDLKLSYNQSGNILARYNYKFSTMK